MALVMTILTVVAALGGISLLLWLSTVIEVRQLGPLEADGPLGVTARAEPKLALAVVDSARAGAAAGVQTAA